ncbi:MAG: NfeD family protein [Acidimicrobiia bacterium]
MLRRLLLFIVVCAVGLLTVSASAGTDSRVDVIVVRGNLDARAIDFVVGAVLESDAHLVVLQMDPGVVLSDDIAGLLQVVSDPPVPLAVWLGPAPASARGGAALVMAAAPVTGAAPGTVIGPALPVVAGGDDDTMVDEFAPSLPSEVRGGQVVVGESPIVSLVDLVAPSIGQFVVGLHGMEVVVAGETVTLETARTEVVDGVASIVPLHQVRFIEPGLVDRVLAVGTQPATVFAFLVFGLALIVFEFYAAGPGIVAAIAASMLLLAGHGMATLPVWWPAVGAAVLAVVLYVVEFQRNDLGWKSVLGTLLLGFAGFRFVGGDETLTPSWWTVVLIVLATVAFFGIALTTVARTRFATQTIGRDHLIGRTGTALGALDPEGLVDLDGARWKARATRAAGIGNGDRVTVVAVRGVVLLVDPN